MYIEGTIQYVWSSWKSCGNVLWPWGIMGSCNEMGETEGSFGRVRSRGRDRGLGNRDDEIIGSWGGYRGMIGSFGKHDSEEILWYLLGR